MKISKSELEQVAASKAQYPEDDLVEIAFVGRSNVGKSSLLNLLTGRKALARVSQNPGKTRTINFYRINDSFRIVDLPGYGYAKVSRALTENWGAMMEEYFEDRKGLKKVIQLVDIRHKPSNQDIMMYDYLRHYGLDGIVVATKADKVSNNEKQKCLSVIRKTLKLSNNDIILTASSLKKTGQEQILEVINKLVNDNEGV